MSAISPDTRALSPDVGHTGIIRIRIRADKRPLPEDCRIRTRYKTVGTRVVTDCYSNGERYVSYFEPRSKTTEPKTERFIIVSCWIYAPIKTFRLAVTHS